MSLVVTSESPGILEEVICLLDYFFMDEKVKFSDIMYNGFYGIIATLPKDQHIAEKRLKMIADVIKLYRNDDVSAVLYHMKNRDEAELIKLHSFEEIKEEKKLDKNA